MSNEFEFVTPADLATPPVEARQVDDRLVLHSEVSPFGWLASDVAVEVER